MKLFLEGFGLFFSFMAEYPVLFFIFIVGVISILVKIFIWLVSYIIIEIVSRVYVGMREQYNLKFSFIEHVNNDLEEEEFEEEYIENLDDNL